MQTKLTQVVLDEGERTRANPPVRSAVEHLSDCMLTVRGTPSTAGVIEGVSFEGDADQPAYQQHQDDVEPTHHERSTTASYGEVNPSIICAGQETPEGPPLLRGGSLMFVSAVNESYTKAQYREISGESQITPGSISQRLSSADSRSTPPTIRRSSRSPGHIPFGLDECYLERTPGQDSATEGSVSAGSCGTPHEAQRREGSRRLRRVLSVTLHPPHQPGKHRSKCVDHPRSANILDDAMSLSVSPAAMSSGDFQFQATPSDAEFADDASESSGSQVMSLLDDEKLATRKGGKVLSNMMSMLRNRGGDSLGLSTSQLKVDGTKRHQSTAAECTESPSMKAKGARVFRRLHTHNRDGTSRKVFTSVRPAVLCSAVSPAVPVVVQQPVAPSIPVVASVVPGTAASPSPAASASASAEAVPAAVPPDAGIAVVPASGVVPTSVSGAVQNAVLLAPVVSPGVEDSVREGTSLMYSLETSASAQGRGGRPSSKKRRDETGVESAGAWDEILQQLQDVLLGLLLLVVLCSLFFGKISAVIATLSLGLLASRVLLPVSTSGEAQGVRRYSEYSESSSGNVSEGSDSSTSEKVFPRGQMPSRDPDAERKQQRIARIMQYSQTSNPKENAVLEGLLTGRGRHAGRR